MLKALITTYYKGNGGLSILKINQGSKRKNKILVYALSIYLFLLFGFMVSMSLYSALMVSYKLMIINLFVFSLAFCFMFSYTTCREVLFKGKDLIFLKPLPIKENILLLSRFLIVYIELFTELLVVYIPFFLVSAFKIKFSVIWYLFSSVLMLATPVIVIAFLSVLIILSMHFRFLEKINLVIVYAFVIWIQISLLRNSMGKDNFIEGMSFFEEIIYTHDSSYLIIFTLTVLVLTLLLSFIAYKLNAIKKDTIEKKQNVVKDVYKESSPLLSLLLREKDITLSDSKFSIELISEQMIPFILLVVYSIMGIAGDLLSVFEIPFVYNNRSVFVLMIFCFFYGFSLISSTSLSREGKEYHILKVYPIVKKDRINSKILFHLIFTYIFAIPLLSVFLILLKLDVISIVVSVLFFASYVLLVSINGLIVDFKNPHLDWETAQEAVKQNFNGMLGFLLNLLIVILYALISYFLFKFRIQALLLPLLITSNILLFFVLRNFLDRAYEKRP